MAVVPTRTSTSEAMLRTTLVARDGAELAQPPVSQPFTSEAEAEVAQATSEFNDDIRSESWRIARSIHPDTISVMDVREARRQMRSGSLRPRSRHYGKYGTFLLGIAFSTFLFVLRESPPSKWLLALALVCAAVGAYLAGKHDREN